MPTHPCRCPYGCLLLIVIAGVVAACDKDPEDDVGPGGPPRPLSIRIEGPSRVTPLVPASFRVLQTWSNGSIRDVTTGATMTSSNPSVLSLDAGLGMPLAAGEVGLTAHFQGLASQRKTIFVIPLKPEWNGAYSLTVGGGACSTSMPPELRQRTFTASIVQVELSLNVGVSTFGNVAGRIFNPEARFYLANTFRALNRGRTRPVAAHLERARGTGIRPASFRRAYWTAPDTSIIEALPDGNRLVIVGEATTTMSPSGFTGTLNGALILRERDTGNQLAVCSSPAHAFVLERR